jgi:hypothetical protein
MALTERQETDQILINADGSMSVRRATVIERDGVEISRSFHRHVIEPGDDVSGEDADVQAVTAAYWTPARHQDHADRRAAAAAERAAEAAGRGNPNN